MRGKLISCFPDAADHTITTHGCCTDIQYLATRPWYTSVSDSSQGRVSSVSSIRIALKLKHAPELKKGKVACLVQQCLDRTLLFCTYSWKEHRRPTNCEASELWTTGLQSCNNPCTTMTRPHMCWARHGLMTCASTRGLCMTIGPPPSIPLRKSMARTHGVGVHRSKEAAPRAQPPSKQSKSASPTELTGPTKTRSYQVSSAGLILTPGSAGINLTHGRAGMLLKRGRSLRRLPHADYFSISDCRCSQQTCSRCTGQQTKHAVAAC